MDGAQVVEVVEALPEAVEVVDAQPEATQEVSGNPGGSEDVREVMEDYARRFDAGIATVSGALGDLGKRVDGLAGAQEEALSAQSEDQGTTTCVMEMQAEQYRAVYDGLRFANSLSLLGLLVLAMLAGLVGWQVLADRWRGIGG